MLLTATTPTESLEKTYRLQAATRDQIDRLRAGVAALMAHINEKESEENVKGHLMDFLKATYYRDAHLVAPKGKTDFVIHTGPVASSPAAVLVEVKRPANKAEMVSQQNLNTKAFHELLLYYFRERQAGNNDIRHCIITNIYEWFIFDAAVIDRLFYRNNSLQKEYTAWNTKQKVSTNNDLFYNEIAKPFLTALPDEIAFTHFDLGAYQAISADADPANDTKLLPLYKILSPTHLLKLPVATDSNRLNPQFYAELLHIIGLEEVKDAGKKLIRRKAAGRRDEGSLLENAITELDTADKLRHLPDRTTFGTTTDEQLFGVGLELCITWINRILFLKLLESQLIGYHQADKSFAFLNLETLADFDAVYKLFFRVLARKNADRPASIQKAFGRIPYLNSSLFEITDLEDQTLSINGLDDSYTLPIIRNSVLTDNPAYQGKIELSTLTYLFAFLNAYDFASEGKAQIQERDRPLINASVLGLIFEKINGYRDGSFFTPGFITEYMCRQTIRRAVVQQFNYAFGWQCNTFADLENKDLDRAKANALINTLRICDPAVGSGHFLVSALNELIAIKCDLGVLQDETGKRLKNYTVSVLNDELLVLDDDGEPFRYQLQPNGKPNPERQRVQKTLFQEKQTLIENCLFGVDINPNSVKICRLRLWIELLKNAYYTDESGFANLETLPNIDINIKQGNSLLSKFSLTEDLTDVFQKQRFSLQTYRDAVAAYKTVRDKDAKGELLRFISEIKAQFREKIVNTDPRRRKLADLRGKRTLLDINVDMFGQPMKDAALVELEKQRIDKVIAQAETELADVQNNLLYRGAFEWRFEFPEVLDDRGQFRGFDVVIGNPPYIRQEDLGDAKHLLRKAFPKSYASTADLYVPFIEHGLNILRPGGEFVYIVPNKWMRAGYGLGLRQWLRTLDIEQITDFGDLPVFEEATTYPCILNLRNAPAQDTMKAAMVETLKFDGSLAEYIRPRAFAVTTDNLRDEGWQLANADLQNLRQKLTVNAVSLTDYVEDKAYYGIKTGFTEAFVIDAATKDRLIADDARSAEVIKPFILGRNIKPYSAPVADKFLILIEKGTTRHPFVMDVFNREVEEAEINGTPMLAAQRKKRLKNLKTSLIVPYDEAYAWFSQTYPAIAKWLEPFEEKAANRSDKGDFWWELRACDYYEEFAQPKIMYQKFQVKPCFIYDEQGLYCNDSMWIITKADKALFAILNSQLGWFLIASYCTAIQNGYQLIFQYFGQIPIAPIDVATRAALTTLVDEILTLKATDSTADISVQEAEINALVYGLYGLTESEIRLVAG